MAGSYKQMLGQVFGQLTVIEKSFTKNETVHWICRCSCGQEKTISGASLRRRSRSTISCGCLQKATAKILHKRTNNVKHSFDDLRIQVLVGRVEYGAKRRDLDFNLTKEQIIEVINSNCFYCGSEPSNSIKVKRAGLNSIIYQGIDRIDSSAGYVTGNIRPCCKICNVAKAELTTEQFVAHMAKMVAHMKDR